MISLMRLAPDVIIYAGCGSAGKWSKQKPGCQLGAFFLIWRLVDDLT